MAWNQSLFSVLGEEMDELVFKPIRQLAELVRTRQVSPVELAKLFLDRLEINGPLLNAVVTVTRRRALEQAEAAESAIANGEYRGTLHGIPYGAKDLLATSGGIPTSWGAAPFRDQAFGFDARVVKKLETAGAVLCAKLAMVELAGGMGYRQPNASFTGPPKNPWNTERWTGGSSSGSGAAVAAGLIPFAIGSETWGSIIGPAGFCGVAGLRPTYGRVSRHGAMALCWTLDKLGPIALTADDTGLVLEAIAGPDPNDATTYPDEWVYEDEFVPWRPRLGVVSSALEHVSDEVKANFQRSLAELASFADLEEVTIPELPFVAVGQTILGAESASAFEDFLRDGGADQLTAPEDAYMWQSRFAIPAVDYLRALRLRRLMGESVESTMEPFDSLVAPSRHIVASEIGREMPSSQATDVVGAMGNVLGLPGITVPNGLASGLPTGILFLGRPYEENRIVGMARLYQTHTHWHTQHPEGWT